MSESEASTDSEDFEYIPEGADNEGGRSDSEESVAGEEEEKRGVSTSGVNTRSSQRTEAQTSSVTSRRTRAQQSRTVRDSKQDQTSEVREKQQQQQEEEEEERQREEKARVDSLWESFKLESAAVLRRPSTEREGGPGPERGEGDKPPNPGSSKVESSKAEHTTVKVLKTYDFAGDEVVVEEEVTAGSKEAQQLPSVSAAAQREVAATAVSVSGDQTISSTTSSSSSSMVASGPTKTTVGALLSGRKRSSGISSVLQSLTKKPKMSTLEKSQLDWKKFKEDKDLEHELAQQRKDGYLERQEFLQRTDRRQYELEREERLKKYSRVLH